MAGSFSESFERANPHGVRSLLTEEWGFTNPQWSAFGSERDDTLLVEERGSRYVLKIAHPGGDPARIERQLALMEHANAGLLPFSIQAVVRTKAGNRTGLFLNRTASLLTYLPGKPIRSTRQDARGVRAIGGSIWRLQDALSSFSEAYDTEHPWALGSLTTALSHLDAVEAPEVRSGCALIMEQVIEHTLPRLHELPAFPTHNDAHTDNVLVDGQDVVGIVDWGDSVVQPWVADLAVAASYARGYHPLWREGDPWRAANTLVEGYLDAGGPEHSMDLLQELVLARLAQRIVLNLSIAQSAADGGVYAKRNMVDSMRDLSDLFASRLAGAFLGLSREALW